MEPSNSANGPEAPRYINFPSLEHGTLRDGSPALNRWSSTLTKGHDFPGAQVRNAHSVLLSIADPSTNKGHALRSGRAKS
jgi:hypothetical protein